ncbi:MAG: PEGA domain-containing protein, partial [Terracidiphilus sp.]
MQVRAGFVFAAAFAALSVVCVVSPVRAQDGKLKVQAVPPQAYVFVDGQAMHESSRGTFNLSPGSHTIDIYNYGYKPATQKVDITAKQTNVLKVTLDP